MTKRSSTKKPGPKASKQVPEETAGTSKLDTLVALLRQPAGATIEELATTSAWQKHSVRGALAGTLRKKGHTISSEVVDGLRRYRIAGARA